jgi:hypothetical protein
MLEKNGPLLFVKPFASADALELDCNLNAQETYVLQQVCPDYSVTCVNKEGKPSKKNTDAVCSEIEQFNEIVIMGKQCAKMMGLDDEYTEWGNKSFFVRGRQYTFWFTPAFGKIMASPKNLKKLRKTVNDIYENF